MAAGTVLICDDNEAVYRSIVGYLINDGIEVLSATGGAEALDIIKRKKVNLMVLDVMMSGIDGYEVCRQIRKNNKDLLIFILSARTSESDKLLGLEIGADDFITKPFSPREVSAKIKNALRRINSQEEPNKICLAELTVYPDSNQVFVKGEEIPLSYKEASVIIYMISNVGKILGRDSILNAVWGYDYFGDTRIVDSMIKTLRQKLIRDDVHFSIRTVYGAGYILEEKK